MSEKTVEMIIQEIEIRLDHYTKDYNELNGELNPLQLYKLSGGISALELLLSWITKKETDEND